MIEEIAARKTLLFRKIDSTITSEGKRRGWERVAQVFSSVAGAAREKVEYRGLKNSRKKEV